MSTSESYPFIEVGICHSLDEALGKIVRYGSIAGDGIHRILTSYDDNTLYYKLVGDRTGEAFDDTDASRARNDRMFIGCPIVVLRSSFKPPTLDLAGNPLPSHAF